MTIKTKNLLFIISAVIFLFLSYIIVLYAQGYKYSLAQRRFVATGAVSLSANTSASVSIDGELKGQTSFLGNSFDDDGLLPGTYKITVQKDSYSSWEKFVNIEEGLVVSFPRVILVPLSGDDKDSFDNQVSKSFNSIINIASSSDGRFYIEEYVLYEKISEEERIKVANDAKGLLVSENKNKIAWWTNNEIWVMWLKNSNYQPYYKEGDKELITRFSVPIQLIVWFDGEDHLIADSGGYKFFEIDIRGGINIVEI